MCLEKLWDLVENRTLFDAFDPIKDAYSPEIHLLEMTSFFGPPPTDLLKRGEKATHYFTAEGAKPLSIRDFFRRHLILADFEPKEDCCRVTERLQTLLPSRVAWHH